MSQQPSDEYRAELDFEVTLPGGGVLRGRDYRIDIDHPGLTEEELAEALIRDLGLTAAENVDIHSRQVMRAKHQGPGGPVGVVAALPDPAPALEPLPGRPVAPADAAFADDAPFSTTSPFTVEPAFTADSPFTAESSFFEPEPPPPARPVFAPNPAYTPEPFTPEPFSPDADFTLEPFAAAPEPAVAPEPARPAKSGRAGKAARGGRTGTTGGHDRPAPAPAPPVPAPPVPAPAPVTQPLADDDVTGPIPPPAEVPPVTVPARPARAARARRAAAGLPAAAMTTSAPPASPASAAPWPPAPGPAGATPAALAGSPPAPPGTPAGPADQPVPAPVTPALSLADLPPLGQDLATPHTAAPEDGDSVITAGLAAAGGPEPAAPTVLRRADLSHVIEDGMVTYPGLPMAQVSPDAVSSLSRTPYGPGVQFQIGEVTICGTTGTSLASPFYRHPDADDLSELPLDKISELDAVLVDVSGSTQRAIDRSQLLPYNCRGRAVLIRTGWDQHWGTNDYFRNHPFLTADAATYLAGTGAVLVGIDSLNIDDTGDPDRPAISLLLGAGIPVCEHLTNLGALPPDGFRFSAVPPRLRPLGSFPVRAYASWPVPADGS